MRRGAFGCLLLWGLATGCGGGDGGGDDDDDVPTADTALSTVDTGTGSTSTVRDSGPDIQRDGTCLKVAGGTDRVRSTEATLPQGGEPRTLQVWVRTEATGEQVALSHGLAAPELGLYLGTSGGYAMASSGGLPVVDPDLFVADGRWHLLVATFEDDLVTLWVDGVRGVRAELVSDTSDGEVVAGGTPSGQSLPWSGWLDDARIYRRVRTDADLATNPEGDDVGLALWWDFEVRGEGAGVVVPDVSGGGGDAVTGGSDGTPAFRPCP